MYSNTEASLSIIFKTKSLSSLNFEDAYCNDFGLALIAENTIFSLSYNLFDANSSDSGTILIAAATTSSSSSCNFCDANSKAGK